VPSLDRPLAPLRYAINFNFDSAAAADARVCASPISTSAAAVDWLTFRATTDLYQSFM